MSTYNQALADAEAAVVPYLPTENVARGRLAIRKLRRPEEPDPRDALIRELTEALKPFAVMSEAYRAYVAPDDTEICRMAGMICDRTTIGDLRRARDLVAKVEGK